MEPGYYKESNDSQLRTDNNRLYPIYETASVIAEMLTANSNISHYRIISKIGKGGMGEVYLAHDTKLDRRVALKVLPAVLISNRERLNRLEQEARAASALNHPNIITIYEIGADADTHFIATEFIEGETLRQRLQTARVGTADALNIATQIAAGLDAAHRNGIVHRDIKPENVMLRADGLVKVLDFGLAKLTEKQGDSLDSKNPTRALVKTNPGVVMGTVAYMSPEQARGLAVDVRTDVFSLGILVYEMLAGRLPFPGATASDMTAALLTCEPAPLNETTPLELQRIVRKSLQKNVDERYQTAKDLMIDLKAFKQGEDFTAELNRSGIPTRADQSVPTQDGGARTTSSAEYIAGTIKQHKGIFTVALTILLLAALGLGYLFYNRHQTIRTPVESLAVLPFENGSGDVNLDYLSDGVSEGVIDRLSQLPQLKVIARNSSFRYRGQNINFKEVANALGVQAIVTGRIVQRGDNYTIRVEMVDVRDNRQLWGESFNRKASDVQALQTDISREIAENLRLRLTGTQVEQLVNQGTANPKAYELLLKGFYFIRKGGTENQKTGVEYYKQAVAIDPNYALAYAELSEGYRFLLYSSNTDPKEITPKWEAAARKALELNENLANAHFAMGQFKRDAWEWQEAEREFKTAIELNPNLARAHGGYSRLLSLVGRHEEAIAEVKLSRELDPLSPIINANYGRALFRARRYDESIEVLKKGLELEADFPEAHLELGRTYTAKAMYREAIAEYQRANKLGDLSYALQIYSGATYAKMGDREQALSILKQLQTSTSYVSPAQLAILYAALDEPEQAFASLNAAYAAHDLWLQSLGVEPNYDSLRSDPRFTDLMRKTGLPQQE